MNATEQIEVNLGNHRSVTVQGSTRYKGTLTGGSGSPNREQYDVVIDGVECEGEWDNDARHATYVAVCPPSLRAKFEKIYEQRERAAERRELARMSKADRDYFLSLQEPW